MGKSLVSCFFLRHSVRIVFVYLTSADMHCVGPLAVRHSAKFDFISNATLSLSQATSLQYCRPLHKCKLSTGELDRVVFASIVIVNILQVSLLQPCLFTSSLWCCYMYCYSDKQCTKSQNAFLPYYTCLQCFDTVGWMAGRASGL